MCEASHPLKCNKAGKAQITTLRKTNVRINSMAMPSSLLTAAVIVLAKKISKRDGGGASSW